MPFDPSDRTQLDTLFNQTMRGPFSDYNPDRINEELTRIDIAPGSVAEDSGLPVSLQGYIASRSYNNTFNSAPPNGADSYLNDVTNKLPGWRFVDDTTDGSGAVQYKVHTNADGRLRFVCDSGAQVGDRVYIEQQVYFPSSALSLHTFYMSSKISEATSSITAGTDVDQFIEIDWVENDGDIYDTVSKYFSAGDAHSGSCYMFQTYGNGQYVNVRIGFEILSTTNLSDDMELGYIYRTDFSQPFVSFHTLQFNLGTGVSHKSTSASTGYTMDPMQDVLHATVAKYTAPAPGFIMHMSTRTDSTISAGQVEFKPSISGTAMSFEGDAPGSGTHVMGHNVESTYDALTYALQGRRFNESVDFDFLSRDTIEMIMLTDGSWSATAGCWVANVTLMLVWVKIGSFYVSDNYDAIAYRGS